MEFNFKRRVFSIIICSLISFNSFAQIKLYVAVDGVDSNMGTVESPLATLEGARNKIREIKTRLTEQQTIEVIISEGNYVMNKPFVLMPEDGGTEKAGIIYRAKEGERPVFSGGMKIEGFEVNENGIWEAEIPESIRYGWRFDQLYVNGERAQIARTPNKGYLKVTKVKENVWERGEGRVADRAEQTLYLDKDNTNIIQGINESDIGQIRFRAYHKWDFTVRFIEGFNLDSMSISTTGQGMKPWNRLDQNTIFSLENYLGALDSPGEWYLNEKGTLYYYPYEGQTPENTTVIAPVLNNLISIEGEEDEKVSHIRFEGITFKHSLYKFPPSGSEPNQASTSINAAIMAVNAESISFVNCEVTQTGQHVIWFKEGCSYSVIEHCLLKNLGGGGIYLGDPRNDKQQTHHIRIENNILQGGGKEFPPAVGIWVGHSSDNEILHNDIGDFYYSGMSVGWTWGYKPSKAKRNKVEFNRIHHIGWDLLSDMAAVYTLGKSEGTVVSNNVIHDIHARAYGGWGLYTDEGSTGIVMENNLVYNTKTGGFHQHYGRENIIRNNILAFSKLYQVQCTRVEEHLSFTFSNNIVLFDRGMVLQGSWNKIKIEMDNNLYWNLAGDTYDFSGNDFKKWQKLTNHDLKSRIANPLFRNAAEYDFNFKSTKNVKKIGFQPFDYSKAGVVGSEEWKNKARLSDERIDQFNEAVEANMESSTQK